MSNIPSAASRVPPRACVDIDAVENFNVGCLVLRADLKDHCTNGLIPPVGSLAGGLVLCP
jgi:hypothetical protein